MIIERMNSLGRLGNYMSTERGFVRASTIGLGVPAAALGAWAFSSYGDAASLVAIPAGLVAAYAWGLIMWRLVFREIYVRKRARRP